MDRFRVVEKRLWFVSKKFLFAVCVFLVLALFLQSFFVVALRGENSVLRSEVMGLEEKVLNSGIPFEEVENCSDDSGELYVFYGSVGDTSKLEESVIGNLSSEYIFTEVLLTFNESLEIKALADEYRVRIVPSIGYRCWKRSGSLAMVSKELELRDLRGGLEGLMEMFDGESKGIGVD